MSFRDKCVVCLLFALVYCVLSSSAVDTYTISTYVGTGKHIYVYIYMYIYIYIHIYVYIYWFIGTASSTDGPVSSATVNNPLGGKLSTNN